MDPKKLFPAFVELCKMTEESDAGIGKMIFRKDDNTPIMAYVVICGEDTALYLRALEKVERAIDKEVEEERRKNDKPGDYRNLDNVRANG